jgi:light-regulated signal transduction histidine kinase (bacteriophytochrome)
MIGMPKEHIIGQVCCSFICPAEKCKCPITDLGQTIHKSERVLLRADGKAVPILKTVDSVMLDGRPHLIESFIDITERKQAEQALKEAHDLLEKRVEQRTADLARTTDQLRVELKERKGAEEALRVAHAGLEIKAEELSLANDELAQYNHIVAHVLKAPLRSIHNYADFIREDLQGMLNQEQLDSLEGLKRAVRQGVELVDRLLEFAVVGAESRLNQRIDLGVFMQELLGSLDLSSDVEVVMGSDWPAIDTEPRLLAQIFENLIQNAIKFNRSPRKRVEIGWARAGDEHYEFFVRDNGIGIDPRYHEQIFSAFERLWTREHYDGAGLGLAIAKKATSKLHGSIQVTSEPGHGSIFRLKLPQTQQ